MAADVEQRADLIILPADHDHRFAGDLEEEVVARLADASTWPAKTQCRWKIFFDVAAEDAIVGVEGLRETAAGRCCAMSSSSHAGMK
jgi:hypothetical protein